MFKRKTKEDVIKVTVTEETSGTLLDEQEFVVKEEIKEIKLKDANKDPKDLKDMDYMDSDTIKSLMDMFPGMEKEEFRKTIMDACGAHKSSLKDANDKKTKLLQDAKDLKDEKDKKDKEKVIIENLFDGENKDAEKKRKDLIDSAKNSLNNSEEQLKKETSAQSKYDKLLNS